MLVYLAMIETPEERDKFTLVYEKYHKLMYHVAYKILNSHQDAEDAVHSAFVAIIRHLEEIDEIDCPKTRSFIVLITERKAIDIIRTSHKDKLVAFDAQTHGLTVPEPGDHGLGDALARLPAHYRQILLLHYDNGYSTRELSRLLNITESGVRKLLGRAKKALKTELERRSDHEK